MKKIIIFLCMAILLSGSLFFFSCKSADEGFDIRGTWDFTEMDSGNRWTMTFSGSKDSGSIADEFSSWWSCAGSGTYVVYTDPDIVKFDIYYSGASIHLLCMGVAENDNTMWGRFEVNPHGWDGNWIATREP
jgi:hypothetical protein